MAKNTGKVREFCQSGKVGTPVKLVVCVIPVLWWRLKKRTLRDKAILWKRIMRWCWYSSLYLFCKEITLQTLATQCKRFQYIYESKRLIFSVFRLCLCILVYTTYAPTPEFRCVWIKSSSGIINGQDSLFTSGNTFWDQADRTSL